MSRYIDAETIEQFIADGLNRVPKKDAMGFDAVEILSEIHFAPTADVAPVVHARWVHKKNWGDKYVCSNCSFEFGTEQIGKYCKECGARMDEVKENG